MRLSPRVASSMAQFARLSMLSFNASPQLIGHQSHLPRRAMLHATRMQYEGEDMGMGSEGTGVRQPSEKQVAYAQRLSQQVGMEIPPDAYTDAGRCSAFIDAALDRTPPTERQIQYAETISE